MLPKPNIYCLYWGPDINTTEYKQMKYRFLFSLFFCASLQYTYCEWNNGEKRGAKTNISPPLPFLLFAVSVVLLWLGKAAEWRAFTHAHLLWRRMRSDFYTTSGKLTPSHRVSILKQDHYEEREKCIFLVHYFALNLRATSFACWDVVEETSLKVNLRKSIG